MNKNETSTTRECRVLSRSYIIWQKKLDKELKRITSSKRYDDEQKGTIRNMSLKIHKCAKLLTRVDREHQPFDGNCTREKRDK
jgi:hypothetical protein